MKSFEYKPNLNKAKYKVKIEGKTWAIPFFLDLPKVRLQIALAGEMSDAEGGKLVITALKTYEPEFFSAIEELSGDDLQDLIKDYTVTSMKQNEKAVKPDPLA